MKKGFIFAIILIFTAIIIIQGNYVTALAIKIGNIASGVACSDCLNAEQIEDIYVFNTGDIISGDLTVEGELTAANLTYINMDEVFVNGTITTSGYFEGQPLNGSLGSGIIASSDNLANCGCINASNPTGLDVLYPDLTIRIVSTTGETTYCTFESDTVTVIDDKHSTYFTDNTCTLKSNTFANYFNKDLSPGDYTRIFDVYAKDGAIESLKGAAMIELTNKKTKRVGIDLHHLSVISGFDIEENTFPAFNQTAGEFVYINTIVTTSKLQTGSNGLHVVYQDSAAWQHDNQTALNLTHCEDSANVIECSSNRFRRYIVYNIGWNGNEFIHELLPQDSENYNTIGACLDVDANPISYTIPAQDSNVANIHHIYCGRRDDATWNGGFIDLRAGKSGFGATIDTSIFFTLDAERPISAFVGTYSNGEASICSWNNGSLFIRDGGCN